MGILNPTFGGSIDRVQGKRPRSSQSLIQKLSLYSKIPSPRCVY